MTSHSMDSIKSPLRSVVPTLAVPGLLARISFKDWIRWSLPLHLVTMGICIVFPLVAVVIGYN